MKRHILLVATVCQFYLQAAPAIAISKPSENGRNKVDVRGSVSGLKPRTNGEYIAQVFARRVYDGNWQAAGVSEIPETSFWSVQSVPLEGPDFGQGFEVFAVLLPRNFAFAFRGAVDFESVRSRAAATSEPAHFSLQFDYGLQEVKGPCAVQIVGIRNADGATVLPGTAEIDVDLTTEISGTVMKPQKTQEVYVVVNSVTDDKKWVMPRKGLTSGQKWSDTAFLGRLGNDLGELFRLSAVVSNQPLPHRSYSQDEWRRLEAASLCAHSTEVKVRRRIAPGDLVIHRVDGHSVGEEITIEPDFDFLVEGGLQENRKELALDPGETVWLLIRRASSQERWTVKSVALVSDDRFSWRANVYLPVSGDYRVIAVASRVQLRIGQQLTDDAWYEHARAQTLRRLSRAVAFKIAGKNPDEKK